MDLLQFHWKNWVNLSQRSLVLSIPLLLLACSSAPIQPEIVDSVIPTISDSNEEDSVVEDLPLTSELIYYILMAEIAGQRGEMEVAVDLYHQASILEDSASVAGRSAQVALYTRNQQRINRALERWIDVDPNDADIYIMQAPFLMLKGDFDTLIETLNTALNLAPEKSRDYLSRIADNLTEITKADQALSTLQGLDGYANKDPEVLFIYARLAAFYKQYEPALPAINDVLKQQADREDAIVLKADILQRLNRGEEAIALLEKIASSKTANENLRFAYAKLLGENNKPIEARTIFEQLHEERPKNEEIIFALGLLALEEKDGKVAKSYFSQLVNLGDRGKQASYFMGLSEELNKNIDAALIWFASVPADSQRFQPAQSRYINLLAGQGNLEKARLHLKLLRKEQPTRAADYYAFEASFLREQKQDQAAFDLYSEALLKHPKDIELLYGQAMVAEPLNRLTILEKNLKAVIAQEPNNSQALNALGYTLTDRTNRHQEALVLIKKAVALKPNDAFYLDSLGWVYYRLGDLDKAVTFLEQAVDIQDDPEFLAHLGEVLWIQDKQSQAKKIWQKALKKDENNHLLKETLRRFGQ
ncbi:MAG: tetratricopeptide repeat protein [Piscirickettsiaceae bacterium]|nr:tetratricopeptide repeat protein [Piscirickettsiaceae bacterium]